MFKAHSTIEIKEKLQAYGISTGGNLYTRILCSELEGKTALFIHGGGSGGNHTMLVRPSKWMIAQGLFKKVILPDRRGEGLSSPLTRKVSIKDHALDMQALLDVLDIKEKITVLGISYGGPIALTLASIDERVNEVILIASSPSIKEAKGISGFLYRYNLLEPIVKIFYKLNLGKSEIKYPDFDSVYDMKSEKEIIKLFTNAIKGTDKKLLDSLLFQNASTLDKDNSSIEQGIEIKIPIYQVIGDKDEIWETDVTPYLDRLPNIKSVLISGANHKASLLRAEEFYNALLSIYK